MVHCNKNLFSKKEILNFEFMKIYLNIASTGINVKMTTSYIKQVWQRKYIAFISNLGRGNKVCSSERMQDHIVEYPNTNPRDTSYLLL